MHSQAQFGNRSAVSFPALPVAALMAVAGAAVSFSPCASGAVAVISLSVNDSPPLELVVKNGVTLSGAMNFIGSSSLDGVTLAWNYVVDLDAFDKVSVNGSTTVTNTTGAPVEVLAQLVTPICAHLETNVKIGTITSLKLTSDADGGMLTCGTAGPSGEPAPLSVVNSLVNGDPAIFCFGCPFTLSSTGPGTITTNCSQGTPLPSLPYPGEVESIGTRLHVTVTPGDKAILTMFFIAKGDYLPIAENPCPGDVDGDSNIGAADLALLLSNWNSIETCGNSSDITGDGIIDGIDLAIMLGQWGQCQASP